MTTNEQFLKAIMGEDAPITHVTSFEYDPSAIPQGMSNVCWSGGYFKDKAPLHPESNQYFCISHFEPDDEGKARRRKVLFRHTRVIVLDDVREKITKEAADKMPTPSWVLETSPGSEQWGYILDIPCTNRLRVENLLDGLVSNGLCPDGKDPGMKGVTRYVRLPEGVNTKANKLVNGRPRKCQMLSYNPFIRISVDDLAAVWDIDLDAERRDTRVDGASDVADHPLINIDDLIKIKTIRSEGRFDITCPWVDEHTREADDGAALFTNADGSFGFKCHHGACQSRTGYDLMQYLEREKPGFRTDFANWHAIRSLSSVAPVADTPAPIAPKAPDPVAESFRMLRTLVPGSKEQAETAEIVIKQLESQPAIMRERYHKDLCDVMMWSKADFRSIYKEVKQSWREKKTVELDFTQDIIYIAEQNQFFDRTKKIWYSTEAYQNRFADEDAEAKINALQRGHVMKVDRVDFAPGKPAVFEENGITFGNAWYKNQGEVKPVAGDCSVWLDHFDTLGWGANKKHILQWMAWTIRHPEIKINHAIMLGSDEGCGKDWLLYPLTKAMGRNCVTISGEELLDNFNDYLMLTKYLHVNETELGNNREAGKVSARIKPLAAAPPQTLRVNTKGVTPVQVRNIVNVSMTTNSRHPLRLGDMSRRLYAVWSDLKTRDVMGNWKKEWLEYWASAWPWMQDGGWQYCLNYLMNEVDLADFNPGAPPPITKYLRDIVDQSRDPLEQAILNCMEIGSGGFAHDIISVKAAMESLHSCMTFNPQLVPLRRSPTTAEMISALRNIGPHYPMREEKPTGILRQMWVIRNHEKYKNWTSEDARLKLQYNDQDSKTITPINPAFPSIQ